MAPKSNPPGSSGDGDLWALYGQYVDAYNSIVQTSWVFSITRYFQRRWMRHLGAGPAWLVVALRQWCYRNKDRWCVVSREQLGRDIGAHEDTVSGFAAKGFASWFTESKKSRSYDQVAGRPKQDSNLYVLLMDDPLAPEDFLAVERLLREAVATATDPTAAVQELLQDLLAMPDPALADHLDTIASQVLPSAKKRRATVIEALTTRPERTVGDLVETVVGKLPSASEAEIRELCSELQRKIVNPEDQYVGTHYFRLNWVPRLGHLLAWEVVSLRSRCYWNPESGELRNECEVWPKTLAEELGCTPRHVRRLQEYPCADWFFQVLGSGRKRPTRYRVQMREPLTPDDQTTFQVLLNQEGRVHVEPGTGQLAMALEAEESDNGHLAALGEEQNGHLAMDNGHLPEDNGHLTALMEADNGHLAADNGHLTAHIKILIKYLDTNKIPIKHQQHADAFSVSDDGGDAVESLLDLLGIYGRNRAKVLDADLAPDVILAWVLNGLAQPDMENLAGYVISQVTSADPTPPPQFLELARLGSEVWQLFLSVALDDEEAIPPYLQRAFERWDALFGSCLREEARQARWQEEKARRQAEIARRWQGPGSGDADEAVQALAGLAERKVWQAVLGELQLQMTRATFDTWVRSTRLVSCQDGVFAIGAPNALARDWLENRLLTTVKRTLVGIVGKPVEVQFVLDEPPDETRAWLEQ